MKKYIDAEVLVKKMQEREWRHPDETTREFVDDLPAADVQEVRHGRWKGEGFGDYSCSLCGHISMKYNFCPWCGANMYGVTE